MSRKIAAAWHAGTATRDRARRASLANTPVMTSGPSADTQHSSMRPCLDAHAAEALAQELQAALRDLMNAWFPRCIDEKHGGYLCDFDHRWKPSGRQLKMLEFQARTARMAAQVAAQPGFESYRAAARHGFEYLRDVMWDHKYGGWFRMLDRAGHPLEHCTKHGHGTSYAIGACVAYYKLTSDPQALDLAHRAFNWIEHAAHDDTHGGYFIFYLQDGTRITSRDQSPDPNAVRDGLGVPMGLKDTNTSADLLEAFADLYQVSPHPLLRERLTEMLHIVRDRIVVPPGAVHMYFQPDWTPVPDICRYAYAVNTANILAKASRVLDADPKTSQTIKSMIDTVLRYSWDHSKGGFFYAGSTFGPMYVEDIRIFIEDKFWWPQAEGTSALLRLALLHPDDEMNYFERFRQLWSYINKYLIDRKRGGWLWVGRDFFRLRRKPKATAWKDPSHEGHSLCECIRLLRSGP
jgi:cellobiose epimerase